MPDALRVPDADAANLLRQRPAQVLKTQDEVEAMRCAGRIVHRALCAAADACVPGATTASIDAAAIGVIRSAGAVGLFRNYPDYVPGRGFPGNICISVNEEVVHGVPGERVIRPGDLVTIDCGVQTGGWCADAAVTVGVGPLAPAAASLLEATHEVLDLAIDMIRPGERWSRIARAMQRTAESRGLAVVREYVGHGIGRTLHELPQAPAFLTRTFERWHDFTLEPGMTIAVEPMLALGSGRTRTLDDGWTVVTVDRSPACHVEHTIAVTEHGSDVLTDGLLRRWN